MEFSIDRSDGIYSSFAADPLFSELILKFVDEMPDRVDALLESYLSEDWRALERLAHQLKGAGGGYGFPQVTELAERLERAVGAGAEEDEIHVAMNQLITCCRLLRAGAGADSGARPIEAAV